jgi:hypothetical protein
MPEGDFRGLRWGDPKDAVIAAESKRSKTVREGWSYETTLAGYPAMVSYGYYDSNGLGGASYSFPWPGEATGCKEPMTKGSRCSLESAKYALDVCGRIAGLLDEKYPSKAYLDPKSMHTPFRSAQELDSWKGWGPGLMGPPSSNEWANDRVRIFQFYSRSDKSSEGWRCSFRYMPSEDIAVRLNEDETAAQNEAAYRDL